MTADCYSKKAKIYGNFLPVMIINKGNNFVRGKTTLTPRSRYVMLPLIIVAKLYKIFVFVYFSLEN